MIQGKSILVLLLNFPSQGSRVTLVCNMLSYVEYYQPKYFMLENVERMINHPLAADLVNKRFVGGIPQGMLKLITSSLASLGSVSF